MQHKYTVTFRGTPKRGRDEYVERTVVASSEEEAKKLAIDGYSSVHTVNASQHLPSWSVTIEGGVTTGHFTADIPDEAIEDLVMAMLRTLANGKQATATAYRYCLHRGEWDEMNEYNWLSGGNDGKAANA